MVKSMQFSETASVRHIALGENNTAAIYMANLYIPIIDTKKASLIKRYEVSNQIAGLHFHEEKKHLLYAVDDSFGLHIFDIRNDSKKKLRLNPEVENHNVTCTAMSEKYLALASSTFGGGIMDVRSSKKTPQYPYVVTLFDIRNLSEPLTAYNVRHKAEITSMAFYKNGTDLLTGDQSGGVRSFNCLLRDEGNATRWERWIDGPVSRVGVINKRITYAVGRNENCNVFIDQKNQLEILYGSVRKSADESPPKTTASIYSQPAFLVGMIKGLVDAWPLIAVWGDNENKIYLTAMDQVGKRQKINWDEYAAHSDTIRCMAADQSRLITGGSDGRIFIKNVDFKSKSEKYLKLCDVEAEEAVDDTEDKEAKKGSSDSSSDHSDGEGPSTSTAKPKKSSKSESSSKKDKKNKEEKSGDNPSASSVKQKAKSTKKNDSNRHKPY